MASLAKSTKLEYSASGSSYTDVGELASISEIGQFSAPDVDVTTVDTTGTNRTFLAGMKTPGTFTFQVYWVKTLQTAMDTIVTAGTAYYWKVTMPDTSTFVFNGILKSATVNAIGNPDDVLTLTGTVLMTTGLTFTAAV
jgi:predicted secreted protein